MPLALNAQKFDMEEINRGISKLKGIERLVRFRDDISIVVYRYPRYRYGFDDDFCSEFYLFFYPTMNRIILSYNDRGTNFATYLFSTLKWQLNRFLRLKKRELEDIDFVKNLVTLDGKLYTSPSEIGDVVRDGVPGLCIKENKPHGSAFYNRILLYSFRFWYMLSEEDVTRLSAILECDREWFMEKIDEIRMRMSRALERKRRIEERRNVAFYRLSKVYRKLEELKVEELGCRGFLERRNIVRKKERLLNKITRLKRIMNNAVILLSKLKLSPSHRVLSEVLGIPKGTIDTSNYMLEKNIEKYLTFLKTLQ